jgi:hypothetical protein
MTSLFLKIIMRLKVRDYRKILTTGLSEMLPVVVVIFASFIELAHIAQTSWLKAYLYNGDSLTLPLIRQSLAHKDSIL